VKTSVSLSRWVQQTVWPRRGLIGWIGYAVLRPASGLFGVGVTMRNLAYDVGLFRVQRAAVPIVSVGNLAVGGTGKTPFTLWLSRALSARGYRVAILSRGYGGSARDVTVVSRGEGPEVSAAEVGDEPVMLAKSFSGPVITAARRVEGAAAAVALGCDVVVLDDGFQHRALARNVDLVLLDGRSGPLLPAGPFRERLRALRRADAIILADQSDAFSSREPSGSALVPRWAAVKPVHRVRIRPTALVSAVAGRWQERPLSEMAGRRVVAVTGIARPEGFYALLHQWEAQVDEVFEFPDHHAYTQADWQRITRHARETDLVVTTEKDLVKLETFPFEVGKLVAVRIEPAVERAEELIEGIVGKAGLRAGPPPSIPRVAVSSNRGDRE